MLIRLSDQFVAMDAKTPPVVKPQTPPVAKPQAGQPNESASSASIEDESGWISLKDLVPPPSSSSPSSTPEKPHTEVTPFVPMTEEQKRRTRVMYNMIFYGTRTGKGPYSFLGVNTHG